MTTDERAEAARLRYLGGNAAECVPWAELKQCVKDKWFRAVDEPQPSPMGHVLRHRLVEAEAKIERQRETLAKLYHLRQRDAAELAALRERAAAPVKVRFDVTVSEMHDAWMAVRMTGDEWSSWAMAYLAAHAVIDAPAGVGPVLDCPECRTWRNANDELVRRADRARAALEGE